MWFFFHLQGLPKLPIKTNEIWISCIKWKQLYLVNTTNSCYYMSDYGTLKSWCPAAALLFERKKNANWSVSVYTASVSASCLLCVYTTNVWCSFMMIHSVCLRVREELMWMMACCNGRANKELKRYINANNLQTTELHFHMF